MPTTGFSVDAVRLGLLLLPNSGAGDDRFRMQVAHTVVLISLVSRADMYRWVLIEPAAALSSSRTPPDRASTVCTDGANACHREGAEYRR